MEWKSPQILLCLIGKRLKAHFILLGEGGVATFTVFDQNHCILYLKLTKLKELIEYLTVKSYH